MKIAYESLSNAINTAEEAKEQNKANMLLAQKQAEEIAALKKSKQALKRVRFVAAGTFATGLALYGVSKIPGIDQNWQTALGATGIGLMGAGGLTFGVSITIPF